MRHFIGITRVLGAGLCGVLLAATCAAGDAEAPAWRRSGVWAQAEFFPLAVWLQSPSRADEYRKAGFNTYVGLWNGPTEEQLAALRRAGLRVICDQNEAGLRHRDDPTIIAWMHGDEPDNAQGLPGGGYGPPVVPEDIVSDYHRIRKLDTTRPVLLNLGQGVAWDDWHGRGVRTRHPEDYPAYLDGCDIASFDIYPVNHDSPAVAGKLWMVPEGVTRLAAWAGGRKPVWTCIESTRIGDKPVKPTPVEMRSQAWQAIIAGARGLVFFVHQFKPVFREAALLDDAEMTAAVTELNGRITALAPVLNSPPVPDAVSVKSAVEAVPVEATARRHGGAMYVFAAASRAGETGATFTLRGMKGERRVEVIGEDRVLVAKDGVFTDRFPVWGVRLYRCETATGDR